MVQRGSVQDPEHRASLFRFGTAPMHGRMWHPFANRPSSAADLRRMIDGWSPGMGDPTLLGWGTTSAYALTACLCGRASAMAAVGHEAGARTRRFWLLLAAVMTALAINKQLDLQSLFTSVGRRMAHDEGWYDMRRTVQRAFIIAVASTGAIVLGLMFVHLRRATRWVRLAGVGMAFLLAFVVIRAASFHHMDAAIHTEWAGIYVDHVLELGGIAIIASGAVGDRWRKMNMSKCRQL